MFKRKKKYTDTEIISLIKKGESNDVLKYLYDTTQPKITAWIIKNNGNREEAQDVFQDAVLSFYRYVIEDKFDVNRSVEAFVFGVGKNMWINRAKYSSRMSAELPYDMESRESLVLVSGEKTEVISDLLSQLGKRCEELLTYSIFYKMTMEDIALRMSFSNANAVKTKNYKCKQRLVGLVKNKSKLKEMLYNE